jgi:phosphomannomutase
MAESLKFGTSGLRGLAVQLQGAAARRYTAAFLADLAKRKGARPGRVYVARDLRASSPAIAADCMSAIRAAGCVPVDCGVLPTPALALHAMARGWPSIMVTGSHIPGDRNGLKFYTPEGEITKDDEAGILAALVNAEPADVPANPEDGFAAAGDRYRQRYRRFLAPDALNGWRIGVFEHSSVARDHLASLLYRAGAAVVRLARAEEFVPVDTEGFSDAIYAPRFDWIKTHRLDAVVSTDGDGDRPLLIDGDGNFVRGDVIGLITARVLGADTVVTPVTSNSGIEALGVFRAVERTKVGSPHVIAAMERAAEGEGTVVGFEANGGTLLGTDVTVNGESLARLPTRDAILPLLSVLASAAQAGQSLAALVESLPLRPALSDRLTKAPVERSAAFCARLSDDRKYARGFFADVGDVADVSSIDGPRVTLASGDVVHYRPSGNAPELRCYVEGATPKRAEQLLRWGLEAAAKAVRV